MSEINSTVPATGCLLTGRVVPGPGGAQYITAHYPVFGLRGDDLTLIIAMHGRPATSADLDSWLIKWGDRDQFYPECWGDGELWQWHPDCECRGATVKREPWSNVDSARQTWDEWKAEYEAAASERAAGAR